MGATGLVVGTRGGLPPGVREEEGKGATLVEHDMGSVSSLGTPGMQECHPKK